MVKMMRVMMEKEISQKDYSDDPSNELKDDED